MLKKCSKYKAVVEMEVLELQGDKRLRELEQSNVCE